MRLIDADAINKYLKDNGLKRDIYVDTAPTVDSVVHCKHCKNKGTAECPFYLWGVMNPDDNDYCCCGEMDEDTERED